MTSTGHAPSSAGAASKAKDLLDSLTAKKVGDDAEELPKAELQTASADVKAVSKGTRWKNRQGDVLAKIREARALLNDPAIEFLSAEEAANFQRVKQTLAGLTGILQR